LKLLLAGLENNLDLAIKHNIESVLVSALYLNKNEETIDKVLSNFDFVFLDSGAFTFWNKWSKKWKDKVRELYDNPEQKIEDKNWQKNVWMKSDERQELWEEHWQWGKEWEEDYLKLLKSDERFKNQDLVNVVEFDVGNEEQMTERRRRFEREGFKVIPVFHPDDSEEYSHQLLEEYDYVGIGGLVTADGGKFEARNFQDIMKRGRKNMTKLHGFGMTHQEPMRKMPFYSVDSTSWLSGARFGTTYEFRSGQLKVYDNDHKDVRKKFRDRCEEYDIDYEKLVDDDSQTVNEWNLVQWKMYSDWLTKSNMKKKQEYWHDVVNGGELEKVVEKDEEGNVEEVEILNSKGEVYDPDEQRKANLPTVNELSEEEQAIADRMDNGLYMECDTCILGNRCPFFKEGSICRVPTKKISGAGDFQELVQYLFSLQQKRIKIGALQESADGGILDEKLSSEIDRMMSLMERYKELTREQEEISINAKGKQSTNVLAEIFGIGKDKKEDKDDDVIDLN